MSKSIHAVSFTSRLWEHVFVLGLPRIPVVEADEEDEDKAAMTLDNEMGEAVTSAQLTVVATSSSPLDLNESFLPISP
jgi:hypothetical protein